MAPTPMAKKRIQKEILDLGKENLGDLKLEPSESSIFEWIGSIPGPTGSVYEGGVFNVKITLPNDYPFSAPKVVFTTRLYHPNVSDSGAICVDVLKNQWSPALSLFKVMLSLSSLLTDPNPNDPLVPGIAREYLFKRAEFDKNAREWTRLYAISGSSAVHLPIPAIPGALPARAASSTGTTFFSLPLLPPAPPQTSLNAVPSTVLPIPSSSRPTRSARAPRRTTANTPAAPVPIITSTSSQPTASSSSRPTTSTIVEVIDLASSPQRRGVKRRREDRGAAPAPKRRNTRRNGTASTSGGDGGEVIVIEDDD